MVRWPNLPILLKVIAFLMLSRSTVSWLIGNMRSSHGIRSYRSTSLFMTEKGSMVKPKDWQIKKIKRKQETLEKHVMEVSMSSSAESVKGLVLERLGDKLLVELLDDAVASDGSKVIHCSQRSYLADANLVAGDKVKVDLKASSTCLGVVDFLEPRFNVLQRPSIDSSVHKVKMRAVASNIDQLLIVTAVLPHVPSATIDRYIVAAHSYGIPKIALVVNKMDLEGSKELMKGLKYYTKIGYKVIATSTEKENGLKDLYKLLNNKTSIFVGQSGVGKSSLINVVLPEAKIKTGELVTKSDIGAHTTSNSHLYHLPTGGSIIDSPGIRELGTWHLSREEILNGFVEIREHGEGCKFADCKHLAEPEKFCAVKRAVKEGLVHPDRVLSYIRMNST